MVAEPPTPAMEPGARDLPLDAHLHTDQSPDSSVPIDVYAALAVERGIPEIAITDHVDFDPRDPAFEYSRFDGPRANVVRGAAERWAKRGRGHPLRRGAHLQPALGGGRPRPPRAAPLRLRHRLGPRLAGIAVLAVPRPVVGGRAARSTRSSRRTTPRSSRRRGPACSTRSATSTSSGATSIPTSRAADLGDAAGPPGAGPAGDRRGRGVARSQQQWIALPGCARRTLRRPSWRGIASWGESAWWSGQMPTPVGRSRPDWTSPIAHLAAAGFEALTFRRGGGSGAHPGAARHPQQDR